MNTVGIVCLSILAGVLLVVIIGGGAGLAVYIYRSRKDNAEHAAKLKFMLDTHAADYAAAASEISEQLASLKGVVTGTRTEMRTAMADFTTEVRSVLTQHRDEMGMMLSRINGEALTAASASIIGAAKRLTDVAATVQAMLLAADGEGLPHDMEPEEAAPAEHSVYSVSPVAADDRAAELEETLFTRD